MPCGTAAVLSDSSGGLHARNRRAAAPAQAEEVEQEGQSAFAHGASVALAPAQPEDNTNKWVVSTLALAAAAQHLGVSQALSQAGSEQCMAPRLLPKVRTIWVAHFLRGRCQA